MNEGMDREFWTEDGDLKTEAIEALRDMTRTQGWRVLQSWIEFRLNQEHGKLMQPATRQEGAGSAQDGLVVKEFATGVIHGFGSVIQWPNEIIALFEQEQKEREDG